MIQPRNPSLSLALSSQHWSHHAQRINFILCLFPTGLGLSVYSFLAYGNGLAAAG